MSLPININGIHELDLNLLGTAGERVESREQQNKSPRARLATSDSITIAKWQSRRRKRDDDLAADTSGGVAHRR